MEPSLRCGSPILRNAAPAGASSRRAAPVRPAEAAAPAVALAAGAAEPAKAADKGAGKPGEGERIALSLLSERFREALRAARDRESMLTAGRQMLSEVERVAGPERADSISERIAMLLPPEEALG